MALVPAKTEFELVPFAGAMDSRVSGGTPPPPADAPVRIVDIPELVFVAGYPEDEFLGLYMLEPGNLVDPSYKWWDTPGAMPRKVGGGDWIPANVSSIVGALPAGVTYSPATTMLSYDGTGSANDRKTVTLTIGTITKQFSVRVVVPNLIWGDGSQWDALPVVYQEGGALASTPRIWAHGWVAAGTAANYPQTFQGANNAYMADGLTQDSPACVLVTRGSYDHVNEEAGCAASATAEADIEWYTPNGCPYLMVLGEPTRGQRPLFFRSTSRTTKFGLGGHDTAAWNTHLKNVRSINTYMSLQPTKSDSIRSEYRIRKCDWSQVAGDVLGRWLDVTDGSTVTGSGRTGTKPTKLRPWHYFIELNTFDRCGGATNTTTYMGSGWFSTHQINGCQFLGSGTGNGTAIAPSVRTARIYNTYCSYLPDPSVVTLPNRLTRFASLRASTTLDAYNCRILLGQHNSSEGVNALPRRAFVFTRSTGGFAGRYPPIYPDLKSEAAPFTDLVFNFTRSNITTAGAVPQIKIRGGAFADAGSAAFVSGETWTVTLASTDFAANGWYEVRLRNADNTRFTSTIDIIRLQSFQNAGYWLVSSHNDQGVTNDEYDDIENGPRAYAPDDGAAFWSGVDRNSGTDPRTNRRWLAYIDVEWDSRPLDTTPARAANAVIVDEGSYPIAPSSNLYGRVPTGWTDLGVTWIANSAFRGFGVGNVPWTVSQAAQGTSALFGVGSVPSPMPLPLVIDFLASNVTGDRPTAATVDLPDYWGDV